MSAPITHFEADLIDAYLRRDGAPEVGRPGPVEKIRRALLDEAQDTRGASGSAREELPGSSGLSHRGQAALLFSERGKGKTTVALMIGVGHAVGGGKTLYLDRENGAAFTGDHIEGILDYHDWPDILESEGFVGRHYPRLDRNWSPEEFGEAIAGLGFTLVIYDSLREAISQLGGDPNSDADISRFVDLCVTPLVRRGVAVVLLDNTGHEHRERPKGSGSKLDAIPQALKVSAPEPFSPVQLGRIAIECTRSRYGDEGRTWTMRVGNGVFEVPEARDEAPDVKAARKERERREEFRRAAVAVLREQSPLGREKLIKACHRPGPGLDGAGHPGTGPTCDNPEACIVPTVQSAHGWHCERCDRYVLPAAGRARRRRREDAV
jgi:hypothetical protein